MIVDLFKKENGKESYDEAFREYVERYWPVTSIEAQLVKKEIQNLLQNEEIGKEPVRVVVALAGIVVRARYNKYYIERDEEWVWGSKKKKTLRKLLKKHFPDL